MTEVFLKIVNMSLSASWLVLAVLAARFLLKKAPKWVRVLLWGLVAVRLLCPFSLESALSLIPSAEVVSPQIMTDPTPSIHTGIDPINLVVNEAISENFTPAPGDSANPLQLWLPILSLLWIVGMAAMAEYTFFTYSRLRRQVTLAIRVNDNVYLSENIPSPFVLGVFRPKIYLPYGMTEKDMFHVIAHERTHIQRRDHWWKPLGFLLLTVHWFNPLMWVAYILLCRDIELACDERVIHQLRPSQRADYSQALLNCAVTHRSIAACPVAFGEVGVKERVKNVLTYRRPAFWIIVIALILCLVVAVCFLTDPQTDLIGRIVNQDGYRILFQTEYSLELSIPRQDYPADCYTVEGHTFQEGQHTLASHFGSSCYIKHIGYSDPSEQYLRFTLDFSYEPEGNVVLVPYAVDIAEGVTVGTHSTPSIGNYGIITADDRVFENGCTAGSTGNGQEFHVDIPRDIWEAAESGVYFTLDGLQRIFFAEEPAFGKVSPRAITHSLIMEDVEFAQATYWGDAVSRAELNDEQLGELLYILYQLPPRDFESATFPAHSSSLMIGCGDRQILLKTDGSWVWFTFDSETAANLDGDWMTQDQALLDFLMDLEYVSDAESFYGVSLTIEEFSPAGATVVFAGQGEKPEGRLLGGNDYWVQVEKDGVWEDITKVPEPSFTTESYDIDNIRRHKIDWQWLYGTLPSGHYRIGKDVTYQEGTKPLETATVWAEFTLSDPAYDAYAILQNLIPDKARAEATFASGGGYNCFREEAESLVQILKDIDESELVVSPAMNPTVSVNVYAGENLTLHYNGLYVQFSFYDSSIPTPWAVSNDRLNDFMETLLSHSPENSTYEIYNVAPLEDLSEHYSVEEAMIDRVVIIMDGDARYNEDVWWEFREKVSAGEPATVRVMHYYSPGESQMGYKVIMDLSFDGTAYQLESYEQGVYQCQLYTHLLYYSGNAAGNSPYDAYEGYLLTNEPGEDSAYLIENLASGYPLQGKRLIYANLIYTPKQPDIPFPVSAELWQGVTPILTVTNDAQVQELWKLMSQSEYLGYEPKTYNLGPMLQFTGEGGNVSTLQLCLDDDLIRYEGKFYDYGPGTNSNGGINNLPVFLGILGLADWPEEVKNAYPGWFAETGSVVPPPANDLFPRNTGMIINIWYPDWAYLELEDGQAKRLLKALEQEAPNPTEELIPDVPDTVFTVHLAFDGGREFDLAYIGQTDFYLRDFQTNQVYSFSSEALRQAVDSAISETKAILYG